ncbi:hypothetical protein PG997_008406 [Apiospora hydei]|uniref:Uncharacterized protein n=1 Tax=Apiospora hydei TaxID=1337664 RepID=A0ABR1WAX1_9PEZI
MPYHASVDVESQHFRLAIVEGGLIAADVDEKLESSCAGREKVHTYCDIPDISAPLSCQFLLGKSGVLQYMHTVITVKWVPEKFPLLLRGITRLQHTP